MSLCDYLDNSDGWTKRSKWFKILNLINVMIEIGMIGRIYHIHCFGLWDAQRRL
jgi:hypothetical protein